MSQAPSLIVGIVLSLAAATARAQAPTTYEIVHAFRNSGQPTMIIRGLNGNLYGTTAWGGTHGSGSIFRVDSENVWTTLHSFGPYLPPTSLYSTAVDPFITLTQTNDGTFYGTTNRGGDSDLGTVFTMDPDGNVTVVHSFSLNDGAYRPDAPLIKASDNYLYGTTSGGGGDGGAVYRVNPNGSIGIVHAFSGTADGAVPYGGIIEGSDHKFYGTTSWGGASNLGTVFRMNAWGVTTILHSFDGADGQGPRATLLQASDSRLFGSTAGSSSYAPTLFAVSTAGEFTNLHSFAFGSEPSRLLEGGDGNLYGEDAAGGDNAKGMVFRTTTAGELAVLHSFVGSDGAVPVSGLVTDDGQQFYGVTRFGGTAGAGSVFRIDPGGGLESLHSFSNAREPAGLSTYLLRGPDGDFYGTSDAGGEFGQGSIFKVTPYGEVTTVHSFSGAEGSSPFSALVEAQDGKFYGTAANGGSSGNGTVFVINGSGEFNTIHHFGGSDGANPAAALLFDGGETFYGTTAGGGANGTGTVFAMDSAGNIVESDGFTGQGGDGAFPRAPLVFSNGTLYGTTEMGGLPDGLGTVFSPTWYNGMWILHSFDYYAPSPTDGLTAASDGLLYGVVRGHSDPGGVFRIDPSIDPELDNFKWVHWFGNLGDGALPSGPLIQASDGALYGTTRIATLNCCDEIVVAQGTVFRLGLGGDYAVIRLFQSGFGQFPIGGVIQGLDGSFYGVTESGGPFGNGGVVFRLSTARAAVNQIWPSSGPAEAGTPVDILGGGFDAGASISIGNLAATDVAVIDPTFLEALTPTLSPGALYDVSVTVSDPGLGTATATHPNAFFADFLDVSQIDPFHDHVEKIFRNGITAGCAAGSYCPQDAVTRAQMPVFLLKSKHGPSFVPPACVGVFGDVPCPSLFANWIEQLAAEGITAGCGGGNYCPDAPVTRAQMSVFLLKAKHGASYAPPACAGVFGDVACPSLFAEWIEQLSAEQITGGCGGGNFCPDNPNTRAQMSAFLVKTFHM
jgi:uncharacterized repeat protein (TIGR03803 family)